MNSAMRLRTGLLLSAMLVTSCGTSGLGKGCAGWKPIFLSPESIEGLTDADAQAILAHNVYGKERGCWTSGENK